jgi:tetratricopeptide (TPR) repeat protein
MQSERDRLAERRVGVVEDGVEVDLALGRHADVVSDLRALVAVHPLRERLRGLLMLALYRCGRQADALAAYQDTRRYLDEELGVEPSADLQRLHRQMLAADPALAAPGTPDTAAGPTAADTAPGDTVPQAGRPPTPAQLPPGVGHFTGRDAELERLRALLDESGPAPAIAVIAGTAGVGKTALAVHWAQEIRDRFPDGQLYVNLRGFDPSGTAMNPAEAIRGFLDAYGVPPQQVPVSLAAQAALYRSLVAGRRVLIVLDNAADAEQVRPLLPGASGCLVLVTSRNQLSGLVAAEGAVPVAVGLPSDEESRRLLARRLGPARAAAEPEAVDRIVSLCARLPLALTIVAARAATHPDFPLDALAGELREARGRLDAFDGEDRATDVRAVFSWSYQRLTEPASRLFRLLGLHPGPDIAAPAAASLAGVPLPEVRPSLTELARAHLVTERVPGRFAFHDLLRAYAAEQALAVDPEPDRGAAGHRVVNHYLHTAAAADRLLNPYRDRITIAARLPGVTVIELADAPAALAWFTAEHPVLLAVVQQAAGAGHDESVWQLAWVLATYLDRRGHFRDHVASQRAALAAARRLPERRGEAYAHRGLARALTWLGGYDEAYEHYERAMRLFDELNDPLGQAHTSRNVAWALDRQGRHADALAQAERALRLFDAAGDRAGRATALNAVGWFHAHLGDHERAATCCEEALAGCQELGDREGEAAAWDSLGYVYHQLGQRDRATACYRRAVDLHRALGDRYYEAYTLLRLGDTHRALGDRTAAQGAWRDALSILEEFGPSAAEGLRGRLDSLTAAEHAA